MGTGDAACQGREKPTPSTGCSKRSRCKAAKVGTTETYAVVRRREAQPSQRRRWAFFNSLLSVAVAAEPGDRVTERIFDRGLRELELTDRLFRAEVHSLLCHSHPGERDTGRSPAQPGPSFGAERRR